MGTVNIALIGYAFMGKAHSNAYRQFNAFFNSRTKPHMKVICGRTEKKVKEAAKHYGWEEYSTNWRNVIERKDIHIVDICTPGDSHHPIAVAAAQAGKVVFCEKPLANTVKEAQEMLKAVQKARVIHMISYNYRKVPAVTLAKQLIDEGRLGTIYHFRGTFLQDWVVDPNFPLVWRFEKNKAGSGALGDLAAHSLDLARYLVGEIAEISGDLRTFIKKRPLPSDHTKKGRVSVDDACAAVVRFANGALGTIEASRFATGRKNYNRFEINGSSGSVAFNVERLNELDVYFRDDPQNLQGFRTIMVTEPVHPYMKAWWPPGHIIGYEHTLTHTVHDLMEAVATGKLPTPNFTDGLKSQTLLDAIERSAKSKKWEKVK